MSLAMKDESGSNLKDEKNDFMLDNSYGDETLEELTAAAVSEVNASNKVHEQVNHAKHKTIIHTSDDDQIDPKIIFDDPYLAKKAFKERENRYLDDIVDLKEKLGSHDRIVYKMGQSIQTIHMLRKQPNKVYDPFLKVGLGYKNPERLKKAIAAQQKISNIVCVSCGKDVFLLSHEKYVARYALSRDSKVKRDLFTTPIAAKSKNLGATFVVAKFRLSVAKTPTATNKLMSKEKKKALLPPLLVPSTESKLELLHMDLCGPMRVASINGKKYILVIVDDYSRYTWVYFLRTKDEAPDMIINIINQVQRNLKAQILKIRTDNGIEFKNEKLWSFYAKLGIVYKTSISRMPQQNGFVKRRNHTLVEAARTMLIFSKTPKFIWVETITTACFTQNRSIVHTRYNKTPYELIRGRKPNIQYFHVFRSLCYPTNNHDNLRKMKPKADIGIFIGYSESSRGFRIYNRQTKKIMETIHVKFDELTTMASECNNSKPGFNCMNFQDSSEDSQSVPSKTDLDNLFGPLYEEYYATSPPEMSDNFDSNTLDNEDTSSSSSIVIKEDEAPHIVSLSAEQVASELNTPVLNDNADELVQEDVAELDGNVFLQSTSNSCVRRS
ncbi:retrovirus-related pol polyprotein from transposon TNT 1-94 [Tanacetum coccineum]